MLKIALSGEEKRGNYLLAWWQSVGAARVYDEFEDAILLEYTSDISLLSLVFDEQDLLASRTIHQCIKNLHQHKSPFPPLVPLSQWFEPLTQPAHIDSCLNQAAHIAQNLLASPLSCYALHGDLHHGNILKFPRGWLAIDPKGLVGEHYFDYLPIFCNPDLESLCTDKTRFYRQLSYVCFLANLDRKRLVNWIVAYSALSSLWFEEDNNSDLAGKMRQITSFALFTREGS